MRISSGSGDITYFVTYTQTRQASGTSSQSKDLLLLQWGDQRSFPAQGPWIVHAELWDGTKLDFSKMAVTNPYVSVTDNGPTITIKATSPESILHKG
jgi:hypothetical protein